MLQVQPPIQPQKPQPQRVTLAFLTLKDPTELRGFGLRPEDVVLNIHQAEELSSDVHQVLLEKTKPHLTC